MDERALSLQIAVDHGDEEVRTRVLQDIASALQNNGATVTLGQQAQDGRKGDFTTIEVVLTATHALITCAEVFKFAMELKKDAGIQVSLGDQPGVALTESNLSTLAEGIQKRLDG